MKKIKISMIAVIALVMGIAGSAFTNVHVNNEDAQMHYIRFDGLDNSNAEIQASSNWVDLGTIQPGLSCDEPSGPVCYVKFNGDLATFQSYVANKTISDLESAQIVQAFREE